MAARLKTRRPQSGWTVALALIMAVLPAFYLVLPASANSLSSRSLELANDAPSATTDYNLSFTFATSGSRGSMDILFCSNSPLQDDSCTLPTGLDVTAAQLTASSGLSGVTLFPVATNELLLSWTPTAVTPPLPVTFTLGGIINPSSIGPYYARLSTYASTNATGPVVDYAGLAFAIVSNLQISSVVPPYLTFCTGLTISGFDCSSALGNYIDFGDLSDSHSSQGDSQMVVATNAPNGYVIQVTGTTMTSGNNIINALTADSASHPGSSQFGINLRANSTPAVGADPTGPGSGQPSGGYNVPNQYEFNSNDQVASSAAADNFRKYTVSYLVNVGSAQAPGVYASTLTYVCAGSF